MRTLIQDFLLEHAERNTVSFHMPGHKGSALYRRFGYSKFLENMMDCDLTEIVGADNLFQAEGLIKEAQDRCAKLYGVKKSYFLINGTSGGNIAAVMASVPKGKRIIMARNCHKSVFNALALANIKPVYAYPDMIDEYGILGAISPEQIETLLAENSDAEAVMLTSPNYYGICSDIQKIAEIVHKYGKILIVDEAHGAHLAFFNQFGSGKMPKAAEYSGADIVITSIHKTLASYTQSAVLHLVSDRVEPHVLEDKLQCIQSTSPSYLLMASLDINTAILEEHGRQLFTEWEDSLNFFYEQAKSIKGLKFIDQIKNMDWSKLNFSLGIPGAELERILMEKYGIYNEFYTGDLVMCLTGIGNTKDDIKSLINALREISEEVSMSGSGKMFGQKKESEAPHFSLSNRMETYGIPEGKQWTPLLESEGLICASSIIPYPPGIPLVCPGEKLNAETIEHIRELREFGEKVIGVNDRGEIITGKA